VRLRFLRAYSPAAGVCEPERMTRRQCFFLARCRRQRACLVPRLYIACRALRRYNLYACLSARKEVGEFLARPFIEVGRLGWLVLLERLEDQLDGTLELRVPAGCVVLRADR